MRLLSMAFPRSVAPFWFFSFSVGVLLFCLTSSIPFCQSFLCSVCLFRNWNYCFLPTITTYYDFVTVIFFSKPVLKSSDFLDILDILSKLIMDDDGPSHPWHRPPWLYKVCTPATGGSTGLYDCRVTPSVSGDRLMSGA